jgi:hypothetical protein
MLISKRYTVSLNMPHANRRPQYIIQSRRGPLTRSFQPQERSGEQIRSSCAGKPDRFLGQSCLVLAIECELLVKYMFIDCSSLLSCSTQHSHSSLRLRSESPLFSTVTNGVSFCFMS